MGVGGQQPAGDARRHDGVSAGDRAYRREQIGRRSVLQQEAARSGPQRRVDVLVEVEGGEDDDPRAAVGLDDQPGCLARRPSPACAHPSARHRVADARRRRPPRGRCRPRRRSTCRVGCRSPSETPSASAPGHRPAAGLCSSQSTLGVRVQPQVHAPAALRPGTGFELALRRSRHARACRAAHARPRPPRLVRCPYR